LKVLSANIFSGCISLIDITIPEGVITIDSNAFFGCLKLTKITIPKSVEDMRSYAFAGCVGLNDITIPGERIRITGPAFYGWTSSQTIYFTGTDGVYFYFTNWLENCYARIVWEE
ncbi:MAG: leucine-rich repeat domain-containing protein, partial [Clostridiales bacterium]|jgi:hypothetical protein|nr:leucine-rich repeat domain-containing protein [Clostridiales bacterium]